MALLSAIRIGRHYVLLLLLHLCIYLHIFCGSKISRDALHCNFIKCLQEGCAIVQFDNAFLSLSKFRQDRPQPGHCIQMLIDSICFFHFVFSVKKNSKSILSNSWYFKHYQTTVIDIAWVQLPVWSDHLRVVIISGTCFEINISDWQEGLTVSSISCDWLLDLKLVSLKYHHGLWVGSSQGWHCVVEDPA